MEITIPASVDEAVDKLGSLGKLLTATEWERAAILAAFVRLDEHGGDKTKTESSLASTAEFAAKGIVGLKSKDTVRRYVNAWMDEVKVRPTPGQPVDLPTAEFPHSGSRNNGPEADLHKSTAGMARALDAKPEQAAEHLVSKMTPEAKQAMATELVKQASDEVEKAVERTGGAVLSPTGADVGKRANAWKKESDDRQFYGFEGGLDWANDMKARIAYMLSRSPDWAEDMLGNVLADGQRQLEMYRAKGAADDLTPEQIINGGAR